jgi:hypothetical protein
MRAPVRVCVQVPNRTYGCGSFLSHTEKSSLVTGRDSYGQRFFITLLMTQSLLTGTTLIFVIIIFIGNGHC